MTHTIWIVDDDEDDRYFLTQALQSLFPNVLIKEITDGDQVMAALAETAVLPNLILLDLNMTRKSGFEILSELRSSPAYENLRIVVLTTSDSPQDKNRSLSLGADDFLTKQASSHALRAMLEQRLNTWRLA